MRQWRRLGTAVIAAVLLIGALVAPVGGGSSVSSLLSTAVQHEVSLTTATDYYGGTSDPYAHWGPYFANGSLSQGTVTQVWTPEEFRPFAPNFLPTEWDDLTLDQSVRVGAQIMLARILANQDPDLRIVTESQSSIIATVVKRWLLEHPDQAPPADQLTFYTFESQTRPNGGIASRFAGVSIPFLGVTAIGPTPPTQYRTYDFAREYEGFVNFPAYLVNLPAVVNAIIGIGVLHGRIADVDLDDPSYVRETVGNTTYITAPTANLPMLVPIRVLAKAFGITDTRVIDAMEPVLKVIVDAGYPGNDPMANQGEFIPATLGIPPENVVRMLQQLPAAIQEGLAILRTPKSTVPTPTNTPTTSLAVESVSSSEPQTQMPSASETKKQVPTVAEAVTHDVVEAPKISDNPSPQVTTSATDKEPEPSEQVSQDEPSAAAEPTHPDVTTPANTPASEPSVESHSTDSKPAPKAASDTSETTPKPAKKKPGFNPGASIKRVLDQIHKATHANEPKKKPASSDSSSAASSSGSGSDSGSN
jgi:hypothetical protein